MRGVLRRRRRSYPRIPPSRRCSCRGFPWDRRRPFRAASSACTRKERERPFPPAHTRCPCRGSPRRASPTEGSSATSRLRRRIKERAYPLPIASASFMTAAYSEGSIPESLSAPCASISALTSAVNPARDFSASMVRTSASDAGLFSEAVSAEGDSRWGSLAVSLSPLAISRSASEAFTSLRLLSLSSASADVN